MDETRCHSGTFEVHSERPGLLSVIVPARNEEKQISRCLAALDRERTKYGNIREIILVDNGSTDRTVELASTYHVKILQEMGTISQIRNQGAAQASGEILCFLDADVEICNGWSRAIMDHVLSSGEEIRSQVFGCLVGVSETGGWIERTWHFYMVSRNNPSYVNSGNMMVHRELFIKLQGFQPHMMTGEDVDFSKRATAFGAKIVHLDKIKTIHHGNPKNVLRFAVREFWHGLGALKSLLKGKPKMVDVMAALYLLTYPIMFVLSIKYGFIIAVISANIAFIAMTILGSARTHEIWSKRALQLGILLTIFAIARSLALPGALIQDYLRFGGGSRGQ